MTDCEVCNKRPGVAVCCVPGVPYSAAYCQECLEADAHPWWVLVCNVACCGGLDQVHEGVKQMVDNTIKHLGKTQVDFDKEVADAIRAFS